METNRICKQANITTIVAQPEQGKVTKTVRLRIIWYFNTIKTPIPIPVRGETLKPQQLA
jgi:hypothetical protein